MDITQLVTQLGFGVGMGALISVMTYLSEPKQDWDNRRFAYTMGIGTLTSLALIPAGIGITIDNLVATVLLVAGSSFFANKGIKIAARLQKSTK